MNTDPLKPALISVVPDIVPLEQPVFSPAPSTVFDQQHSLSGLTTSQLQSSEPATSQQQSSGRQVKCNPCYLDITSSLGMG